MRNVCAKYWQVPEVSTDDQTWAVENDPGKNQQSTELLSWRPQQRNTKLIGSKVRFITFIDESCFQEFVSPEQTNNATHYVNVLERLWKRVLHVRKENDVTWVFHHDNTLSPSTRRIREFLAKHSWTKLLQSVPYSPNLTSVDLFLYEDEDRPQRSQLWRHLGDPNSRDGHSERDSFRILQRSLPCLR